MFGFFEKFLKCSGLKVLKIRNDNFKSLPPVSFGKLQKHIYSVQDRTGNLQVFKKRQKHF